MTVSDGTARLLAELVSRTHRLIEKYDERVRVRDGAQHDIEEIDEDFAAIAVAAQPLFSATRTYPDWDLWTVWENDVPADARPCGRDLIGAPMIRRVAVTLQLNRESP